MSRTHQNVGLILLIALTLLASPAAAFGAGNIASISKIEGHNWRHGDIEDLLKTVPFLTHHKWTSLMIKRAYFGNWLRDYSQALDVGTLKSVQADTIRILVWVLSFLSFGYATEEFEVTNDRLGVYRPEEHIDNPKDYADNADARRYDPRLRPPIMPVELALDPNTGMKNYIANEAGNWATSSGYIRYSFSRSIHFGRVYTSGAGDTSGRDEDLYEALRCLGQGLHCVEDFAAHTNYVELALREVGFTNVFTHTGTATEIPLRGRRVFPLVTGTFGTVDFLHSVLGEATDHFAQTEVEEMDLALADAQKPTKRSSVDMQGGLARSEGDRLIQLLSQLPGPGAHLSYEAQSLRTAADDQERRNATVPQHGPPDSLGAGMQSDFSAPPGSAGGPPAPGIPGMNPTFDPVQTAARIYPILAFRDRVVKAISATIEKVPGLQALCEKISETVTLFILSLLAPFIRPIIKAVSKQLKEGSSAVVDSSGRHQYEPWTNPQCTDPTHSLLSKDHFSNVLNEVAGQVAAVSLQYVAPRVIYTWSRPDIPIEQVLDDVVRVFHHPAIRDQHCQLQRDMYGTVEKWARSQPNGGHSLNDLLSSASVKDGKNHSGEDSHGHGSHTAQHLRPWGSHSKVRGSEWEKMPTRAAPGDIVEEHMGGYPLGRSGTSSPQIPPPAPQGYEGYPPSKPNQYPSQDPYGGSSSSGGPMPGGFYEPNEYQPGYTSLPLPQQHPYPSHHRPTHGSSPPLPAPQPYPHSQYSYPPGGGYGVGQPGQPYSNLPRPPGRYGSYQTEPEGNAPYHY